MSQVTVRERPKAPASPDDVKRAVDVAQGVVLADQTKHARWGWADPESKRSRTRIANLKRLGYRPATEADVVDMQDAYKEPDGTIHRGDQILLICERAEIEERENRHRAEQASVERRQVKQIESGEGIETDRELHHQRIRGKEVDLA